MSLVQLTDYVNFDDFVDGDRACHLALVEPCVRGPGVPDPEYILFSPWSVQGREPGVLDVREVVQAKHLGYRITVSKP